MTDAPRHPTWVRAAAVLAGPLLVVAAVLLALRRVAFTGLISPLDPLRLWLPTYCYLGRSLAAGHVPLWNPYTMAGAPFAADPQSGWMYLPAMALFAGLPCGEAIRAITVLQPLLAGVALYGFCRVERAGRTGATCGALVLALVVSRTELSAAIPFSAAIAWTAVTLAAVAKLLHARTVPARLVWGLLAALAWGQLAAAHPSVGLAFGSLTVGAYAIARAASDVRAGRSSARGAGATLFLWLVSLPIVNAAYLLPRLAYVPQTSLGLGYARLQQLVATLAGKPPGALHVGGTAVPAWPLIFAGAGRDGIGGMALVAAFAAFASRRHRTLAIAFGIAGVICYALSLGAVARRVPSWLARTKLGDFYLHAPHWFGYGVVLVLATLVGLGVDAVQHASGWRARVAMLVPGALVWGIPTALAGQGAPAAVAFGLGAVVAIVVLVAVPAVGARWRLVAPAAIPVVLVAELVAVGSVRAGATPFRPYPADLNPGFALNADPDAAARPDAIVRAVRSLGGGRFASLDAQSPSGPGAARGASIGSLFLNAGLLHDTPSVNGYNAVQILRFWMFVRAAERRQIRYNRVLLRALPELEVDLLAIDGVVAPSGIPPPEPATQVTTSEGFTLYRLSARAPMASIVPTWSWVSPFARGSATTPALQAILAPGFDVARRAVLERADATTLRSEGAGSGAASAVAASATFAWSGTGGATVHVSTPSRAAVLVRIPYANGWRATVDGRPAEVVSADFVDQAVVVAAGRHVVELRYHEPTIWLGLAVTVLAAVAVLMLAAVLARRGRRAPGPTDPDPIPARAEVGL